MNFKTAFFALLLLFVFAGGNAFADSTQPGVSEFIVPDNNSTTTVDAAVTFEWSAAAAGDAAIEEYQIQYFKNRVYTGNADYDVSITGTARSISFAASGTYYLRVRAKDAGDDYGEWSNGAGDTYRIIVDPKPASGDDDDDTLPPIGDVLARKAKCMKGLWNDAADDNGNQMFKNQGQCVAYYNQQILGHVQNMIKMLVQKMQELKAQVQKQNQAAQDQGYKNWGQYMKAQKAKGNGK